MRNFLFHAFRAFEEYYDDAVGGVYPTGPWGKSYSMHLGRLSITITTVYSLKTRERRQKECDKWHAELMDGLQAYIDGGHEP